jgi:hypothetical protein
MKAQDIISGNTALLSALIVLSMFQFGFCSQVLVGAGHNIQTYDMEGNHLSSFYAGQENVLAIAPVNNNLWLGMGQYVRIYDMEGNDLSYFSNGGYDVTAIEVVNNNVWVGMKQVVRILDTEGNELSSFSAGSWDVTAIKVVPEPATLFLFGVGAVILRKRKK